MINVLLVSWIAVLSVPVFVFNYNLLRTPPIEEKPNEEILNSTLFISEFQTTVRDSEELFSLFTAGLEEAKNYSVLFTILSQEAAAFNSDEPEKFAKSISDSFSAVLNIMTPTLWGKAIASSILKLLNYFEVKLTGDPSQLSEQLASNITNLARTIRPTPHSGDSFRAVIEGSAMFIISFIEPTPEATRAFSKYISEEFIYLKYH